MENYQKICFIFALLVAIFIFYSSSLSFKTAPKQATSLNSIIFHFSVFFAFASFLFLAQTEFNTSQQAATSLSLRLKNPNHSKLWEIFIFANLKGENIFLVLLISLIYAAFDEMHQYFVPGRFSDVFDVATDFLGSLTSVIFLTILNYFRRV